LERCLASTNAGSRPFRLNGFSRPAEATRRSREYPTNGEDDFTLKLYAIEGSAANDWLARVRAGKPQLDDPRLVHGIFTYDYFSIVRAIGDAGGVLGNPINGLK